MGAFFIIPIFLQSVLGYSAVKAGFVMAPMSAVIIFAAPLAGVLSDRLGSKWIVAGGMFVLAAGLAWMAGLLPGIGKISPDTSPADLVVPFAISGIGIGLAVAPVTSAVMATAPRERVGNASGVLSTMRQVGSLMGIALLGAVLQNRVTAAVTEGVRASSQIPPALKERIVAAAAGGSVQLDIPEPDPGMPATAVQMLRTLFMGWFTDAMASTFVWAVALAVAGGLCALLLRSRAGGPAPHGSGPGHGPGDAQTTAPDAGAPTPARRPG